MSIFEQNSQLLSVKEAAALVGVSQATMWRWIRQGHIPTVKIGGLRRIRRADFDRLIKEGTKSSEKIERIPPITRESFLFALLGAGASGQGDISSDKYKYLKKE